MRATLLIVLVVTPSLALAGCAADEAGPAGGGPTGDDGETPPAESPPRVPDRTSVWGELVHREPAANGTDATRVTVDAELLDCERVDRRVPRTVDLSRLGDLPTPEPPLTREQMNEVRTSYNESGFTITHPTELEPGRLYLAVWNETAGADGERHVTRSPAVFVAYHADNRTVELSSARYPDEEPNLFLAADEDPDRRSFHAAKRPWVPADLETGQRYHLTMHRTDEGPWTLSRIDRDRPDVEERCRREHADDLAVDGPHRAASFPANETRRVELDVANRQDGALTLTVQRVHLVNETAYAPHLERCPEGKTTTNESRPGPEGGEARTEEEACAEQGYRDRRQAAILEACRAEPEPASLEVPPGANATLTVAVTCEQAVPEAQAEHLWLWGTAAFTDELGLEHTLGEDRYARWAAFEDVHEADASAPG